MNVRDAFKAAANGVAMICVVPALLSYAVRSAVLGPDRALEGSTQALSLWPGLIGQYMRRAFLARTLGHCAATATIEFGTIFSQVGARIDEHAYIGPHCHIGLVHIEHDVLIAGGVHVPSGSQTHGIRDATKSIRDQAQQRHLVTIGAGSWIGSGAVVMADVGPNCVVGAGAVVTRPLEPAVVAAGVPARVIRRRDGPGAR